MAVRRTVDRWRRRDSILLVGALAFVEYLLILLLALGSLGIPGDLGVALLAASVASVTLAEALFAVRPTPERLARADRLIVATIAIFAALGLAGAIAMALQ